MSLNQRWYSLWLFSDGAYCNARQVEYPFRASGICEAVRSSVSRLKEMYESGYLEDVNITHSLLISPEGWRIPIFPMTPEDFFNKL